MSIIIRAYQTLEPASDEVAFYARAIAKEYADEKTPAGGAIWREGTSVGFYGRSADEARNKAAAWVEAERLRSIEVLEGRVALAEKFRATAAEKRRKSA